MTFERKIRSIETNPNLWTMGSYADIEAAHKALPQLYASAYPPALLDDPLQPDARGKT